MSVAIHAGNRVHFVGDSITAGTFTTPWYAVTGGFVTQVNAALGVQTPIVVTASGVSGNRVADIATDMTARVFNFTPDVVVVQVGVNDVTQSTLLSSFSASCASIYSQTATWKPGTPVLWVGPMTAGELWQAFSAALGVAVSGRGAVTGSSGQVVTTGTASWGPNTYDGLFPSYVTAIKSATTTAVQAYADPRAAALTYEAAHNVPANGLPSGVLTTDGTHPIDAGSVLMGSTAFAQCAVS